MTFTKNQAAVLGLLANDWHDGQATEGELIHYLYPLVLRPRLTVLSLEKQGLVQLGGWESEENGYRVFLTAAGRAAASTAPERPAGEAQKGSPDA